MRLTDRHARLHPEACRCRRCHGPQLIGHEFSATPPCERSPRVLGLALFAYVAVVAAFAFACFGTGQ